jgi:hypothetical protein
VWDAHHRGRFPWTAFSGGLLTRCVQSVVFSWHIRTVGVARFGRVMRVGGRGRLDGGLRGFIFICREEDA